MLALPSLAEIESAAAIVARAMPATPQHAWPLLARRLGADVWVKHENHTPTGAFKVRGGLVYLDRLVRREPGCPGIVAATRGNHGQSLAFAARRVGIPMTVVVPRGNSREKNLAMVGFGVELVEHGDDFQDALMHSVQLAAERGLHHAPSFHGDLVAGVATYWLELFRAVPSLDVVFVPIGLGSGLCAAIAARAACGVRTKIVAVVSAHAPTYALSIAAGRPVESPVSSRLGDGMACRIADPDALRMIDGGIDGMIEVNDDELARAMKALYVDTHNVAEGAGAASLAAAMQVANDRPAEIAGRRVGLTLCGGNVDHEVFARVLLETPLD